MDFSSRFEEHFNAALSFQKDLEKPAKEAAYKKERMSFARELIADTKTSSMRATVSSKPIDFVFTVLHPVKTIKHYFKNLVVYPIKEQLLRSIAKSAYKMFIPTKDVNMLLHKYRKNDLLAAVTFKIDSLAKNNENFILEPIEKDQIKKIIDIARAFEKTLIPTEYRSSDDFDEVLSSYLRR